MPTPLPLPSPAPPIPRRPRRPILVTVGLLLVSAAGFATYRHHVTRPEYRFAEARGALAGKEWSRAERLAERLEGQGEGDRAWFLRGELARLQRRPQEALAAYNRVRADGPFQRVAASASGRCLIDLGNLPEAFRVLSFVVEGDPDDVDAQRGLAAIAYDLGQLSDAVTHLKTVARLDPQDGKPHRLVGLISKDMAQYGEAEAAYREALTRDLPREVRQAVLVELAETLLQLTRYADALETVTRAGAGESPLEATGLVVQAEALRGLGRQREAVEVLDRALVAHPESATLLRIRGLAHLEDGQAAAAVPKLQKAVSLAPSDEQAQYQLAQAYGKLGRAADAKRTQDRADELRADYQRLTDWSKEAIERPWDGEVRRKLAEVCRRLDRAELATMWDAAAAMCGNAGRK